MNTEEGVMDSLNPKLHVATWELENLNPLDNLKPLTQVRWEHQTQPSQRTKITRNLAGYWTKQAKRSRQSQIIWTDTTVGRDTTHHQRTVTTSDTKTESLVKDVNHPVIHRIMTINGQAVNENEAQEDQEVTAAPTNGLAHPQWSQDAAVNDQTGPTKCHLRHPKTIINHQFNYHHR